MGRGQRKASQNSEGTSSPSQNFALSEAAQRALREQPAAAAALVEAFGAGIDSQPTLNAVCPSCDAPCRPRKAARGRQCDQCQRFPSKGDYHFFCSCSARFCQDCVEGLAAADNPSEQPDAATTLLTAVVPEGSDEEWVPLPNGDEIWVTPPSSPGTQVPRVEGDSPGTAVFQASEFDMQVFANSVPLGPVTMSLAEALAVEVDEVFHAACAAPDLIAATLPATALPVPVGLQQVRGRLDALVAQSAGLAVPMAALHPAFSGQICCPRCWQALTPRVSSGVTCFSCGGSPTPGGQALHCDQCGVETCCACIPLAAEEFADEAMAGEPLAFAAARCPGAAGVAPVEHDSAALLISTAEAMVVDQSLPPSVVAEAVATDQSLTQQSSSPCCPCGMQTMARVKLVAGKRCSGCKMARNRGCGVWVCSGCGKILCLKCVREGRPSSVTQDAQDAAPAVPAVVVASTDVPVEPAMSPELGTLLERLRMLPPVLPVVTPHRVPKRARRRIGRLICGLVEQVIYACAAVDSASAARREEAALLCSRAYVLMARRKPDEVHSETGGEKPKEASAWKLMRRRLQLAEAGKWHVLVDELLDELRARGTQDDERRMWGAEDQGNEASSHRKRGVAVVKIKNDCARTAAQILRGQTMLTPCAATAEAQGALIVTERTRVEQAAFEEAIDSARAAGAATEAHITIKARHVKRRLEAMRVGAQPGGSKCRNDVLAAVGESRRGVDVLTRWCQLWADGKVACTVAATLQEQVLRPLRKPNGKPRNISLMECLLKFPAGVVQDVVRECGDADGSGEGLHWSQYGGQPAGPELMLMVGQGLMNMEPHLAFVSLDGENAYGRMRRRVMLEGTVKWCPRHANLLACQWSAPTQAWIESNPGEWQSANVVEGTAQGETSSTPAFSRGYRVVLEKACSRISGAGVWVHLPSLVDDLLLVTAPENVDYCVGIVAEELAVAGMALNLHKSSAFIPACDREGSGDDPRINSVPQVTGGLRALGSAYGGDFEVLLGPAALPAEPAQQRLAQAAQLANELGKYRMDGRPDATLQAAWYALRRVVAKALVYDARVLEPSASLPLAQELDAVVDKCAQRLLGVCDGDGWNDDVKAQLAWPPELSGLGFGSATLTARLGRLAAVAQCLPTAREHLKRILPHRSDDEIREAISLSGVDETLQWLRDEYDIEISASGAIAAGSEPRFDPHQEFQPIRGIMGIVTRAVCEKQREHILQRHGDNERLERDIASRVRRSNPSAAQEARSRAAAHLRHCARLRSTAGEGAGAWVEFCPKSEELRLNDSEFNHAVRWRIGLPVMRAGPCQVRNANTSGEIAEERCGQCLDALGDHAVLCGRGGGKYRAHTAVCRCLGRFAREAGIERTFEEVCPQLLKGEPGSDHAVEARLDVHMWSGGQQWLMEEWVDATVGHPWRKSGRAQASSVDGSTAAAAEGRKRKRYGEGQGGITVSPFAVETWGRLGTSATELLAKMAAHWAGNASLGPAAAAAKVRRWRAELGIALARAQAATAAKAGSCSQPREGHQEDDTEDSAAEVDS